MTPATQLNSVFKKGAICLFLLAIFHSQGWAQIGPPPVITAQPMDTSVANGGIASFSVSAASGTSLTYQWYKVVIPLLLDKSLPGQTGTSLVLANVASSDAGQYYVTVKNASGTVASSQATLTVLAYTPPVAVDDNYSTRENVSLVIEAPGVLANDTCVSGQNLTALLDTNVSQGSVILNTNGGFVYTPNSDYFGIDSFTYRASDGLPVMLEQNNSGGGKIEVQKGKTVVQSFQHGSAGGAGYMISKIVLYVSREAKLASASPTFAIGTGINSGELSGSSVTIPVSSITNTTSGASFQTCEIAYSTPVGPFTAGTTYYLNLANPGDKRFFVEYPNSNSYTNGTYYNDGSDQYEDMRFQIYGATLSNPATVTISVNDPPIAINDTTNTPEDASVTIHVLANDRDLQGTPLTLTGASTTNGTAVISGTNVVFSPSTNFNGIAVFDYVVSDGTLSATGLVTVAVTPVNDPPVSFGDNYTTLEDTTLIIPAAGILTNDADVDGDALTVLLVSDVSQGSLSLNANGGFTYTPNANFNGSDSFTYRAADNFSTGNVATVTITITPVNDPPVANNDNYATLEDVPLVVPVASGILTNDTDVEGNSLKAVLSSSVAHGTLNLNINGSFTYTPATNFNGSDSFTYRAADNFSTGNVATVTINITPDNDGSPVAYDDVYTTLEDVPLNVPASGVLLNDTDVDGDALTATLLSNVSNGSLSLNANGSFTYMPNTNYNGSDNFTYRVSDGFNPVAVVLQQNANGGNKIEVKKGTGGAQSFRQGNAGEADYTISKIVLYVSREPALPAANPVFSIGTNINAGAVARSSVTIPASSITNKTSGASFQTYVINYSTPLGPFTAGTTYYLNLTNSTDKRLFVEYANANTYGNGTYYADESNQNKDIRFQVFGFSDIATVTINITPVTDAPIANDAAYITPKNVLLSVPPSGVLANVTNVENAPLTASLVATVSHGILNLNTNGSFSYKPISNYSGSDFFTYRASVLSATSAVATVSLTVRDTQTPLSFVSTEMTASGFILHLSVPGGYETVVEASTNLVDWIPIFTNAEASGLVEVVDEIATNIPSRFYRAVAR